MEVGLHANMCDTSTQEVMRALHGPFAELGKRLSGRSRFGLPSVPDQFNVGHFSVRPNFARLLALPVEQAIPYLLALIHETSSLLLAKQKKLGGFDAVLFRARFVEECARLGYVIKAPH